ncbi:hypothetical protein [Pseudoalteromonas mariniglutinosa]
MAETESQHIAKAGQINNSDPMNWKTHALVNNFLLQMYHQNYSAAAL